MVIPPPTSSSTTSINQLDLILVPRPEWYITTSTTNHARSIRYPTGCAWPFPVHRPHFFFSPNVFNSTRARSLHVAVVEGHQIVGWNNFVLLGLARIAPSYWCFRGTNWRDLSVTPRSMLHRVISGPWIVARTENPQRCSIATSSEAQMTRLGRVITASEGTTTTKSLCRTPNWRCIETNHWFWAQTINHSQMDSIEAALVLLLVVRK